MKPWPNDAVMIVAADAGKERREQMEQAVPRVCRDCGKTLMADTHTFRLAWELPSRKNRPIRYFCVRCAAKYTIPDQTYDDRGRNRNR